MTPLWLKTRARRSPWLLNLYLRRMGRRHLGVFPGRTEICIDAYFKASFLEEVLAHPRYFDAEAVYRVIRESCVSAGSGGVE